MDYTHTEDAVEPSRNAGTSYRGELLYSGVDLGTTVFKGIDPDRIIDDGPIGGPIDGPEEKDPSSEPEETTDWTEKAGTITGYRYYSPDLMRFINQDILVGDIGNSASLNRYCYVESNPATNIDPFGLNPQRSDEDTSIWAKVDNFVSDNAVAIAIGTDVILIGATIVTGGATAPILVATLAGQGIGVVGGGTVSAIEYYLDNGTLSGVGGQIYDSALKYGAYGTLAGLAAGATYTSITAYEATKALSSTAEIAKTAQTTLCNTGVGNPVDVAGLGNTGRTIPYSLNEQMSMHQVMSNPLDNAMQLPISMSDVRWLAEDGWIKMQSIVEHSEGKTVIHFVHNVLTGVFDDFKFK